MRGVYTAVSRNVARTDGQTLMYLTAPAAKVVEILGYTVTNPANDTNEQLEVCLQRVSSLGTPTGTTLTPSKHDNGDSASGTTAVGDITASEPTYAASTAMAQLGFPSLAGCRVDFPPEERPTIPPGGSIGLRHISSAMTSQVLVATITYREIG